MGSDYKVTEREQLLSRARLELSSYMMELMSKYDLHIEEAIALLVSEANNNSKLLLREMKR